MRRQRREIATALGLRPRPETQPALQQLAFARLEQPHRARNRCQPGQDSSGQRDRMQPACRDQAGRGLKVDARISAAIMTAPRAVAAKTAQLARNNVDLIGRLRRARGFVMTRVLLRQDANVRIPERLRERTRQFRQFIRVLQRLEDIVVSGRRADRGCRLFRSHRSSLAARHRPSADPAASSYTGVTAVIGESVAMRMQQRRHARAIGDRVHPPMDTDSIRTTGALCQGIATSAWRGALRRLLRLQRLAHRSR